jgi:hypothetical protein
VAEAAQLGQAGVAQVDLVAAVVQVLVLVADKAITQLEVIQDPAAAAATAIQLEVAMEHLG